MERTGRLAENKFLSYEHRALAVVTGGSSPFMLVTEFSGMQVAICVECKEQSEDWCFDYWKPGRRESSAKVGEGG